jgi:hypothetical protein
MAKKDSDLFDRLRQAGVRKQVAKTLSEIGDGASKKALRAAKSAIAELRSLADEIERRLPSGTPGASAISKAVRRTPARSTGAAARPTRARTAGATTARSGATTRSAASGRKTATAPRRRTAAASPAATARAPRGANKAKILASLNTGPKTASEIAKETGIGTGTVGSTLSKLATSGEVVKAERGYRLPT